MPMNTHYSPCMDAVKLLAFAQSASRVLVGECKLDIPMTTEDRRPVLVYTGMSGIGMATGLAMYLHVNYPHFKFAQLYVRKFGEQSHGLMVEMSASHDVPYMSPGTLAYQNFLRDRCYPVLVDDCISSGATFGRVYQALSFARWTDESWRALLEDGLSYRFKFNRIENTSKIFIENNCSSEGDARGYQPYEIMDPISTKSWILFQKEG